MSSAAETLPAESAPSAAPLALRLPTPLALAAIEAGCDLDDVTAYVSGRPYGQLAPITTTGCRECDRPGCACALKAELLRCKATSFEVRFYNPKARRGTPSVQTLVFTNKADAGTFASRHVLYGKPAVVKAVSP